MTDPVFYLNFLLLILVTVVVAVVGGGSGIALGRLIRRSDWLARLSIRALRLGMWLPFFLLWPGSETLRSFVKNAMPLFSMVPFPLVVGSGPGLAALLAVPTVLLGTCYYYLSSHVLTKPDDAHIRFHFYRNVFMLSLAVCLLWQCYAGNGWPWRWTWGVIERPGPKDLGQIIFIQAITSIASMVLLMAIVFISNRVAQWSLAGAIETRQVLLSVELRNSTARSSLHIFLLAVAALLLWQVLSVPLTYFSIPPPFAVMQSLFSRFPTGQLWQDTKSSLLEILGGLLWAGLFATLIVEFIYRSPRLKRYGSFIGLISVSPIVFHAGAIVWFGIGGIQRAIVVSSLVFFAMVQALWSYRQLSSLPRLLIAIDEALPYAFVGMLIAETVAATAGLGFYIVVATATRQTYIAVAGSFFLFGLLLTTSGILRSFVKRSLTRAVNGAAGADI